MEGSSERIDAADAPSIRRIARRPATTPVRLAFIGGRADRDGSLPGAELAHAMHR